MRRFVVVVQRPPNEHVGRTIPLVIAAFALAFAGVFVVDLLIERLQIEASDHVAGSTISTLRTTTEFGRALHRFHDEVVHGSPDGPFVVTHLVAAQGRLDAAMEDFAEHLGADDLSTWRTLRDKIARFEGSAPIGEAPAPALEARIHAIEEDLSTLTDIVGRRGLTALASAQRLHTLEGGLEACVLFFLAATAGALLLGWQRQEARVRSRDAEVQERLRRTVADLDGFAGRLAHDLRSPLTPILVGSQWIERAAVPDAVRTHAERIERSALRLGRMIDALLQYTRVAAGVPLEGARTPLNAAVQEIVVDFEELASARGACIETDLGPDATLACPPEVLQSILTNLVENALKYGGTEGAPPHVTVRTRAEGPCCAIEVEDAGPGVPPELREQVFRPMFRGQKGGSGIGLGLSIVQRLVGAQGGRVEVLTAKEGGALFRVVLPLGEMPPSEAGAAAPH